MATLDERLNEWLRDAHAAEEQAATMLTKTADRNLAYPQFASRLKEQAQKNSTFADMVALCLGTRGAKTSLVKDATARLTAMGQAFSGLFVADEVVKAALATSTFAHMQLCSYRILVAAANEANDNVTQRACEDILGEHQAFGSWLEGHLRELTAEYLRRETAAPGTP